MASAEMSPLMLMPEELGLAPYHQYEVIKEIAVESGPAIPWFDEVGKGTQYKTGKSVEQLIDLKCLRRIL